MQGGGRIFIDQGQDIDIGQCRGIQQGPTFGHGGVGWYRQDHIFGW